MGRSGQRPELNQANGMALVRCILGKFLGVACHCFPLLFRYPNFSPPGASTSATTWEIPSGGSGNCCPIILPKWRLPRHLGIFYMPQIYDMGPTALLPLRRKACLKIRRLRPGLNPRTLVLKASTLPLDHRSYIQFITIIGGILVLIIYRVSQEERAKLREGVPYVKLYRHNPKHLYPKLNGYEDNGHRKVWASRVSTYCTPSVTP